MKKLKLILASALMCGVMGVYAQDSTKISEDAAKDRTGPGVGAQEQTPTQSQDYRKDMSVMQSSEIPPSLRATLQGDQYKGWENSSTIYRSKNNDAFVVEMRNGTQTAVHRFDQNGKPVKDY